MRRHVLHAPTWSNLMWTEEQRERYRVEHKRYPSDLTDPEWEEIEDLFASYESYSHTLCELVNACLYLSAEGCRWQSLPKDFPPSGTVRWWWDRFHREGVWQRASARLVRLALGAPRQRPPRRAEHGPDRQP